MINKLKCTFLFSTIFYLSIAMGAGVSNADTTDFEERRARGIAILGALNREAEQRIHFPGAKNLGVTREQLEAMITHAAHYAGWPVAASALRVLAEVWPAEE